MANPYLTDWNTTFNKANVAFAKDWNGGYNGDKAVGKIFKTEIADVITPSGVIGALSALDKVGEPKLATAKAFKAALDKFESEKKKYVAAVSDALALKLTVKEKSSDIRMPTPLKDVFPDSHRQLKILQTEVAAYSGRAANALKSALDSAKQAKIEAEKNKAKDAVKGADDAANAKLKKIADDAALKTFQLKFLTGFKSAMLKGAAAIQKMKATPDLATYNKEMNDGGRDISQNLLNIAKLKADPKFKSSSLAKKLPDPGALGQQLIPFANGAKRALAPTSTPQQVKAALDEFSTLYKQIAAQYKDALSGKIK